VPVAEIEGKYLDILVKYSIFLETQPTEPILEKYHTDLTQSLNVDQTMELLKASNFINLVEMTEMLAQHVADQIRGKSSEQIREYFGIKDHEFTDEEIEEIKKEQKWCEEAFK
jgi:hypothetical protein